MSEHRSILKKLHARLHDALEGATEETLQALVQEVIQAARELETDAPAAKPTRGRRGPVESPLAVEPPTFPGHKRRL